MSTRDSTSKAQAFTEQEVIELLELKILLPEDNDNFFKGIIGNKEIVNYFSQLVKLFKSDNSLEFLGKAFHPSFLLLGVEGSGKALTTFTFANEMDLPIIVIDSEKLLQDISNKMIKGIKDIIKKLEKQYGKTVVLLRMLTTATILIQIKVLFSLLRLLILRILFLNRFSLQPLLLLLSILLSSAVLMVSTIVFHLTFLIQKKEKLLSKSF